MAYLVDDRAMTERVAEPIRANAATQPRRDATREPDPRLIRRALAWWVRGGVERRRRAA